jgi:hypothetical protein
MKAKIAIPIISGLLVFLLSPRPVHAHCPICTGAVGIVAASAQIYGVDATIVGLLVGVFALSMGMWMAGRMKTHYFKGQYWVVTGAVFLLTIIPLMFMSTDNIYLAALWFGEPGTLLNRVYWVDKLFAGSLLGGITGLAASGLHHSVKKLKGRVLFPYQGVAFTVGLSVVVSLLLYMVI